MGSAIRPRGTNEPQSTGVANPPASARGPARGGPALVAGALGSDRRGRGDVESIGAPADTENSSAGARSSMRKGAFFWDEAAPSESGWNSATSGNAETRAANLARARRYLGFRPSPGLAR